MKNIMKKSLKISILLLIILITCIIQSSVSYAVNVNEVIDAKKDAPEEIEPIMSKAIGVAMTIGTIIAATMIVVIAIKYMISAPNEKAEIKKYMIPYAIGAILVFASSGVVGFIIDLVYEGMKQ